MPNEKEKKRCAHYFRITPIKTQSQEKKTPDLEHRAFRGERFDVGNVFDQFCSPVSYLEQSQEGHPVSGSGMSCEVINPH